MIQSMNNPSLIMELPLPPSGNNRNSMQVRRGKVHVYRKNITQKYYEYTYFKFKETKQETITQNCWANVYIHARNKNRDADNVIKTLFDALQYGRVVSNDKLIKRFYVEMVDNPSTNKIVLEMGVV